jgi:UDP-2,3-diacylglucosamine hydrolase
MIDSAVEENATKYEAVFISDLHLHPMMPAIEERFNDFITWAQTHCQSVYILGDFFHVWIGDDGFDDWSLAIAKKLKQLSLAGIKVYFMPGNRDFLIGKRFYQESSTIALKEPTIIELGGMPILLVHGDRYCTKDKTHQWFRKLTRNPMFISLFLKIPFAIRHSLVNKVRAQSQAQAYKPEIMSTVPEVVVAHMKEKKVGTLIHGHTHRPTLIEHSEGEKGETIYKQYILSDWDDKPKLLCYDNSKGFNFIHKF